MHAFLLAAVLTAGHPAGDVPTDARVLATAVAPSLRTGTLLFTEGDCLAIMAGVGGPYTHVAAVVICNGAPVVYDSMNGVGVRKLSLEAYLQSQAPDEIDLLQPRAEFSPQEALVFEAALEQRIGAPYSVLHYIPGRRAKAGVHCSEYVTDALEAIERIDTERPPRVSPSSLHEGLVDGEVYAADAGIRFPLEPVPVESDNWCEQLWLDTKLCCANCCDSFAGWFLCR